MLYSIKDKWFGDFYDLLVELKSLGINKTKINTLIQINFFSEFGGSKKLLDYYEIFQQYYGKSSIKKDKIPDWLSEDLLRLHGKETEKQFSKIDFEPILRELLRNIPDENLPLDVQAELSIDLTGSLMVEVNTDKPLYYVQSLNKKFTPFGTFYSVQTGEVINAKVQKKKYEARPFKEKDFLYISGFDERFKWYKTDNGFEQSNTEKELHVSSYTIKPKSKGA